MYDNNNIFAKIIDGKIPCKKIYEDKDVLFFEDIKPIAKIHILGIPKVKCVDFSDFVSNYEASPFKVAKNIKMMVVDAKTGKKADFSSKETIIESFKKEKIENNLNNDIEEFGYNMSKSNILKFY